MADPLTKGNTISSPDDQSATFIELFFDLIFVFSVTQVVGLLHGGFSWSTAGQAVLVFWLVWWAWTQFTWALNAADTTHAWVEIGTLAATAVAFFMAITLPEAFQGHSLWFAVAYVLVRAIGLILYIWVSWQSPSQRAAVSRFALVSLAGLAAVLMGGFAGGLAQYGLWGLAIALDVFAASIGGQHDGWNLHPEHFSERHGLFTIIALGETLIVAGSGVLNEEWSGDVISVAVLAVVITCGLWWTYFPKAKPALEHAMTSLGGAAQAGLARDVFSLFHFPMLCGVIIYAYALEEAIAHPGDPLPFVGRLALALGFSLFVGGMAAAVWRATGKLLVPRVLLTLGAALAVLVLANVSPLVSLMIVFAAVVLIAFLEERADALAT